MHYFQMYDKIDKIIKGRLSYLIVMFFRLLKQLAEKESVTEQLKAANQMLWVARMNNIRNQATEIVNAELIYI